VPPHISHHILLMMIRGELLQLFSLFLWRQQQQLVWCFLFRYGRLNVVSRTWLWSLFCHVFPAVSTDRRMQLQTSTTHLNQFDSSRPVGTVRHIFDFGAWRARCAAPPLKNRQSTLVACPPFGAKFARGRSRKGLP
jgi:hypothetical protein